MFPLHMKFVNYSGSVKTLQIAVVLTRSESFSARLSISVLHPELVASFSCYLLVVVVLFQGVLSVSSFLNKSVSTSYSLHSF